MSDTKATLRAELLKRIRRAGFDILELKTECLTQIDSAEMYGTEDDSEETELKKVKNKLESLLQLRTFYLN